MNRNWHRRAVGGLPILSAALLSAAGFLGQGALSDAAAQSSGVVVNYDALNALGAQPNAASAAAQPAAPQALATPPSGAPASGMTMLGPDGRPVTPIKLRKPGSSAQAGNQVAAQIAPAEPSNVPAAVPMPEATPNAPAPGVNSGQAPEVPVVETPTPPAEQEAPAPDQSAQYGEQPAPEQPVEQPVEQPAEQAAEQPAPEQPAEQQASKEPPAPEAQPAETPPAEGEAAKPEEEQPAEEAAEAPPEPDNTQPAPPIPQGGIRIVYPADLNDVPAEANAALDDLAAQMLADESMRVEIRCYASGTADTESKARRKSLARCLSIRQHLFTKDVRTTRMDVRALGLKSEGQPADRVDIVPANS
jgi:outer membrane protein OmpA-like peptidoglycan-associated protein